MIRVEKQSDQTLIRGTFGHIVLASDESIEPMQLTAKAVGFISLGMVAADYRMTRVHTESSPDASWIYTADVRRVTALNPLNVLYLARIARLRPIRHYRVVLDLGTMRGKALRVLAPLVRATPCESRESTPPRADDDVT